MTRNVGIRQHWGAFGQPFLQWNNSNYYIIWVCVCLCVALSTQREMGMRHIVICDQSVCTPFVHIIPQTIWFSAKSFWVQNVFWFSIHILSETFFFLSSEREVTKNLYSSSCKGPVIFFFNVNQTWIFCKDFRKILKYQISWKSVRWGPSCSMRTDRGGETDSHCSQFCETA
jgi:hypothetical protein